MYLFSVLHIIDLIHHVVWFQESLYITLFCAMQPLYLKAPHAHVVWVAVVMLCYLGKLPTHSNFPLKNLFWYFVFQYKLYVVLYAQHEVYFVQIAHAEKMI